MPESPEQLRARLRAEIAAIEKGVPKPSRAPDLPHVREEREDRRPSRASRSLSASAAGGQPSRHDAGEVDEDVRLSDPDAAFRKIERLCLVRERASEQLRQRLARGGFEAEAVEAALDRALACGLVDDGRFADVLVRSRLAQGAAGAASPPGSGAASTRTASGAKPLPTTTQKGSLTVHSRCSTASRLTRKEPPRRAHHRRLAERHQRLSVISPLPLVRARAGQLEDEAHPRRQARLPCRLALAKLFLVGLYNSGTFFIIWYGRRST